MADGKTPLLCHLPFSIQQATKNTVSTTRILFSVMTAV